MSNNEIVKLKKELKSYYCPSHRLKCPAKKTIDLAVLNGMGWMHRESYLQSCCPDYKVLPPNNLFARHGGVLLLLFYLFVILSFVAMFLFPSFFPSTPASYDGSPCENNYGNPFIGC